MTLTVAPRATPEATPAVGTTSRWARRGPTVERPSATPLKPKPQSLEPPPPPPRARLEVLWPVAGIGAAFAAAGPALQPGWVTGAAVLPPTLLLFLVLIGCRRLRARHVVWALPSAVSLVGLIASLTGVALFTGRFPSFGGGWRDLFVSTLPARTGPDVLAAVGVTAWVAVTVAVAAGLAGAARAVTVLPAVAVFVLSCALCLPLGGVDPRWLPVVVGTLAFSLRTPGAVTAGRVRRVAAAVVVVGLAAGAGLLVPLTVHRADLDPRPLLSPPVQHPVAASPLAWVSAWQPGAPVEVFDYRGDLGPAGTLRWVTLDRYDGLSWTTTDRYTLAGSQIRQVDEVDGPLLHGRVSGLRLPGAWLPSPAGPVSVTISVKLDPASGTLIATDGHADEYLITAGATPPSAVAQPGPQPATDLPGRIVAAAEAAGAGAASDLDRLRAVEAWARSTLSYDPSAPAGQSLPTVTAVLSGRRAGTMDQVVSGFALLARELGYQSRVVVGFDPSGEAVHSTDIVAWPEVFVTGRGWQPFYPVPLPDSGSTLIVREHVAGEATAPTAEAADAAEHPVGTPTPSKPARGVSVGTVLGVVAATLALAVMPGIVVWRRVRGRSAGTAGERTLAAWRSLQRGLGGTGHEGVPALTCDETVELVKRRLGSETPSGLDGFAADVTGVLFAGQLLDEAAATRARQVADQTRRALRRSLRVKR